MNEEQPSSRMTLLNGADGTTNCVESDVIRGNLSKVTNSLFEKLSDHYGPFSMFAGLNNPSQQLDATTFTKDGANIIRAMTFVSVQEDWARKLVGYIGNNIENEAGDGTTSAMMFACGMLRNMYETIDSIRPISYNQLKTYFADFVEEIRVASKPYVFSAEKDGEYDPDRVRALSYIQAYTSSHGNASLAEAVADVFSKTPSEMWKRMGYQRRMYESDKEFEVICTEGQYQTDAKIMTKSVFNAGLKRYLEYKNATLIILNEAVMMDSMYWKVIEKAITESTQEKPVVIFAHSAGDGITFGKLMEFTKATDENGVRKYQFAVISHNPQDEHQSINDFVALQTIVGADLNKLADDPNRPVIVEGISVKFMNDQVTFDGLYKDPENKREGIDYRPQYSDPEKPYFRFLADGVRENIDAYENKGELTMVDHRNLNNLRKMLTKLLFDKRYVLVVGGKTYDNLAMNDVVDDVIRATRAGLERGMVVSNNKTLYLAAKNVFRDFHHIERPRERAIAWLAECTMKTLEEFASVVYRTLCLDKDGDPCHTEITKFTEWWMNHAVDLLRYDTSDHWSQQPASNCMAVCSLKSDNIFNVDLKRSPLIVQPANADIVMLERFGDIALKFILTKRLIFENSVYLNKKKE